jgi:hypothetical protein
MSRGGWCLRVCGRALCFRRALFGALTLENFGLDTLADLPVEQGDFSVDGDRSTLFCSIDHLPNFLEEGIWGGLLAHGARAYRSIVPSIVCGAVGIFLNPYFVGSG